jgi:hypothetical protein
LAEGQFQIETSRAAVRNREIPALINGRHRDSNLGRDKQHWGCQPTDFVAAMMKQLSH